MERFAQRLKGFLRGVYQLVFSLVLYAPVLRKARVVVFEVGGRGGLLLGTVFYPVWGLSRFIPSNLIQKRHNVCKLGVTLHKSILWPWGGKKGGKCSTSPLTLVAHRFLSPLLKISLSIQFLIGCKCRRKFLSMSCPYKTFLNDLILELLIS